MTLPRFYSEDHYPSAVKTATANLLQSYRGYQIDVIRPLPNSQYSTRAYQLWITAWDINETRHELVYRLRIGVVKGELVVLSWMPL